MPWISDRIADLASAFLTQAVVMRKTALSDHFVRVDLQSDKFRSASWTPGCKVQLRPETGTLGMRTYTPFGWDAAEGTTSLVGYVHGTGPASRWFDQVKPGDTCELMGPRRSLDLTGLASSVVFVGDESSVGLATALRETRADGVTYVLEAADPAEYAEVLAGLGVTATVVPKNRRDLLDVPGSGVYDLVVTGDAATVGPLRRAARDRTPRPAKILGKAYWAEGRTGLD